MKRNSKLGYLAPVLVILIGVIVNNMSAWAAVHVGSGPWVWQNPLPQGYTLNAISCFSTNNCIAVGDNGAILATTNGGTRWAGEPSVTTQTLRAVNCANTSNCAAVGDHGTILTTTNGGVSWTSRSSGTAVQLLSVYCDAIACLAVGPSTILLSTDGGATWSPQAVPANSGALNGISCHGIPRFPVDACFAESGSGGQVFQSNDTGFIWSTQTTPSNGPLGAISCSSLTNCVAVANDSFTSRDSVIATTNGGSAWSRVTVDHFARLNSVSCVDNSSFCVAVGGSKNAFFTTNGGFSWTAAPNGMLSGEVGLNGVSCPSTTTCFAVGDKGAITKTTNGGVTWTSLQTSVTDDFLNLAGVSCPAEGTCFGAGGNAILATTNGGATWSKQLSGSSPQAVSCPSTSDCFAVGTNLVLATTNGGASWASQTLPTSAALDAISCPSTSDCFAGGTVMLATTNGGKTWTQQPFFGGTVLGISCASTKTCVAVGFGGTISRTTDGLHWTQEPRLTSAGLHGVSCPTASDCIAVGDAGVILASTNSGVNWSFQPSTTTSGFSSVSCLPPGIIIGASPVCSAGTFLGEIFSGAGTWRKEAQVEPVGPLGMSCAGFTGIPTHYQCIAVGDSGVIVSKQFAFTIGTAELTPKTGSSEVGEPTPFQVTWTVPSGKSWRDVESLDLRFTNESGIGLWARFLVGETSTFALLDGDGNIVAVGVPGSPEVLESDAGTLDLAQSGFQGTGPAGPSVTATFVVSFKGSGLTHHRIRMYKTELTATDVDSTVQGPEEFGTFAVRGIHP